MVLAAFIMGIIAMAVLVVGIIGVCCSGETQEQKDIRRLCAKVKALEGWVPQIRLFKKWKEDLGNRDITQYLSPASQPDLRSQPEIEAQRHWDLLSGLQHEVENMLTSYQRNVLFNLMAALRNERYPVTQFERHAFLAKLFPDKRKGKSKRGRS